MKIQQRVATARQILRDSGIGPSDAEASARLLAQHVLGCDTGRYLTMAADPEPPDFAERYADAVRRRARREPAAYITGRQEFWGLPFEVSSAVLIPRPDTELIVQAAVDAFGAERTRRLRAADVCTGSGNLAIAVAHELTGARLVATDISTEALVIGRRNADRHGLSERVQFVRTDLLEGIAGPFDLIVANPPYVRLPDRPALQPEVRDYEPGVALFGGANGTEVVARVVQQGAERLRPGGFLMFEFGFGQDDQVEELIAREPALEMIAVKRDLQGIARTVVTQRKLEV